MKLMPKWLVGWSEVRITKKEKGGWSGSFGFFDLSCFGFFGLAESV